MFAHACKLRFEGIISKKADAPYRSERSDAWVKIKCVERAKFPVVGFVKDPTGVAALHLGRKVGRKLIYVGKVGRLPICRHPDSRVHTPSTGEITLAYQMNSIGIL